MIEEIKFNEEIKEEVAFDYKKHLVNNLEINNELNDFLEGRIKKGYNTGFSSLDDHYVFKENEFYLCTGKKGDGKTTINQALQLMGSVCHGLIWAVAYQENNSSFMKLNLMNYLLSGNSKRVKDTDKMLYDKASQFIDKHFIFLNVDTIKDALETTRCLIEIEGIKVHAIFLDPINSFGNGWQNTGNVYADGVVSALNILLFTKKYCSIHVSQHPTMSGQRTEGAITSYQGEGGWFLNKASYTYVINREKGTNINHIIVDNVRNKHTGGGETDFDNPVVIEWSPTSLRLYKLNEMHDVEEDIFRTLTNKNKTFGVELIKEDVLKNHIPQKLTSNIF